MVNNKVITKNWDIAKVSKELNLVDLLESWHKAGLNEISLRKNAFVNKENFKKWWFAYLKAESLDMKVHILRNEFNKNLKKTDEQLDFIDEVKRINTNLKKHYEHLTSIYKLMNKNRKKVLSFIAIDEQLRKYKVKITIDFLNVEGHDISDEDAKTRKATWGIDGLKDIWEALEDDKWYEPIRDDNGQVIREIKTWGQGTKSWDPEIRQKMFESWYSWDFRHRKTLLSICKLIAARLNQNASYYKYKSWVEEYVNENLQIDVKDYYYMIDSCSKFANAYYNFNSYNNHLIAKAYGLKQYQPWDWELKIQNTKDSITQAQCKKEIFDSLAPLGDEYMSKVKKCFDNNIIYWSKENRKIGGYCISGTSLLDVHPIYFNWEGTTESAGTLAHELGHSIASEFVKENNEIDKEHNDLFSEIPSIINTFLFGINWIKRLKANNAPKVQLYAAYTYLIDYLIVGICDNGFYYQLADRATTKLLEANWKPADFEISALELENDYCRMSKSEYASYKNKWPNQLQNMRYYRLYIHAALNQDVAITYYLGCILALAIAPKILNGDKDTLNRYLKFLKTGTSIDPIKTVKTVLGIDLLKPQVYTQAKHNLEKLIKDFKKDIKI